MNNLTKLNKIHKKLINASTNYNRSVLDNWTKVEINDAINMVKELINEEKSKIRKSTTNKIKCE